MNSCYMLIKVGKGRCLMTTLLAKVYFSHFIFWGWWLWNKKLLFKFRYEKINLDSVPLLLIKLVWKNLLPSLFHSLNLKTWSCFTKSKFVLVIDHPYHIFGLWFSKVKQTRDPFLQYLNFFNKSKKRCDMFFQT